MRMSEPRHPVWSLGMGLVALGVLTVILYFSASDFDETELEAIGWFAILYGVLAGGLEGLKRFAGK